MLGGCVRLVYCQVCDSAQYATWLNWFSRFLLRDNKHAVEKEQVAKLVRAVVEVGTFRGSGARTRVIPLSETIMRAVIVVAEHAVDPFPHSKCLASCSITLIQCLTDVPF